MRTDKGLHEDFRNASDWRFEITDFNLSMTTVTGMGDEAMADSKKISHSFSGHERNHLFRSEGGARFDDISPVSGLDHDGDSRGFCLLDFDRDGWTDIAMINANRPTIQLFRNQIGDLGGSGRFIAVRLQGGNRSAAPSRFAARDGYGASVRVRAGDLDLLREHRCGDGFAAQNSAVMLIGIGDHARAESLSVTWPSGVTHRLEDVPAGALVTAFEDPAHSASGAPLEIGAYGAPIVVRGQVASPTAGEALELVEADGRPTLYVTFATTCEACIRHLPHERRLHEVMDAELRVVLVPIDAADDAARIDAWRTRFAPAAHVLQPLAADARARVLALLAARIGGNPLPASILTDAGGRVLSAWASVPSVSELRALLKRDP